MTITFIFAVVGAAVLSAFAVAAIFAAVGHRHEMAARAREVANRDTRELAVRDAGRYLVDTAHWWSESPPVVAAVKAIGAEAARTGYFRVANARDRWRRSRPQEEIISDA